MKASGALVQDWGKQNSTPGGCTQDFIGTGTQSEAVTAQNPSGPHLPMGPGKSPREAGVAMAHCRDKDTDGGEFRKYSLV